MKKNNDEIKERVVQTAISIDDVRVVEKIIIMLLNGKKVFLEMS